jgi:hypothetical protein
VKVALALALAANWSTPQAFDPAPCKEPAACVIEPAPRVAVNARGQAAAAWVDAKDRVRVAVATRAGRFGAATTLARHGLRPSPAVAPDGTVTVVWEQSEGLRFARAKAGRFGRAQVLAPRESGSGFAAAKPDGTVVVVYEAGDDVRAVTLSRAGRAGAPVTLGTGGVDARVAPDGTLAACCVGTAIAVHRSAWKLVPVPALGENTVIETVFASAKRLILGLLDVRTGGDAGDTGIPGIAAAGADDALGPPAWTAITQPTRGLEPDATIDGSGRTVLVFQQKDGPRAFSRVAPVYASVAGGRRTPLTSQQASAPTVRPLGPGALAVWPAPHGKWGVAIERGGRFRAAPAPTGPGPGEDFLDAYDLATSGRYAVLTWVSADGAVRVSERSGRG